MTIPAQRTWLQRNTTRLVLGAVALGTLLFVVALFAIAFAVTGLIRSSEVYDLAMARAESDPRVQAVLGRPVQAGYFVSGSLTQEDGNGSADLRIPLSGRSNKGTLRVVARKHRGEWTFTQLRLQSDDGKEVDLTPPVAPDEGKRWAR